jgi:hypothetical protein
LVEEVLELLRLKADGKLFHREGRTLEFKEQFNLAGLADYFRDFAAFANNKGGFLVFGVKDNPRALSGLTKKSIDAFEKIDPEKITGFLGSTFSSEIRWEATSLVKNGRKFAAFKIYEAATKPVIAIVDEGRDQSIRNGDIYYRYNGRTQRILSAELQAIITDRIDQNNKAWIDHVQSIGAAGPQKSMVISTEDRLLKKQDGPLVIDQNLAKQLQFIKEGKFVEKDGATALKLVGEVVPVDAVEVEKTVEENVFGKYPYSAMEVWKEVKRQLPDTKQQDVWNLIKEEGLKGDIRYSKYNFRNRAQEEKFNATGQVPHVTPVIYNEDAITFLVNILRSK